MRKLLYALAAVAPLAAFGTATAAPAHPTAPAAPAGRPFNLPGGKCFKITDIGSGNYGSLYYNGSKILSSHSHYTAWCPTGLQNGWQVVEDSAGYTNGLLGNTDFMADHPSGNYLNEINDFTTGTTCGFGSQLVSANTYCEWAEFKNSSGNWDIESANTSSPEYITAVGSGSPVELDAYGTDDQHFSVTCVLYCT